MPPKGFLRKEGALKKHALIQLEIPTEIIITARTRSHILHENNSDTQSGTIV